MATPLLERPLLERLERLAIHWQRSFSGLVGGHNTSRYPGGGLEFLDHRRFHPGDDVRAVNWRAYLRLGKLFLKIFQVEPRTPIRLLVDASLSMTATDASKFEFARRLAAALAYVGLVRHDSLLIQPFGERLNEALLATGGRHRFGPVNDFLAALAPAGQTNFLGVAREFISSYGQPGLLIIVSDFLSDDDVFKPLQHLADFGHELLLAQVWTESDRTPRLGGEVTLIDAETGATRELAVNAATCHTVTRNFDLYCGRLEDLALRTGGRYAGLATSMTLDEAVLAALGQGG